MNGLLLCNSVDKNPALQAVWFYYATTTGRNLWL
jgi:hypothetical protein